jgi:hypothetical protein
MLSCFDLLLMPKYKFHQPIVNSKAYRVQIIMLLDIPRNIIFGLALTVTVRCTENLGPIDVTKSIELDSMGTAEFPSMPEFLPAPDVEAREAQKTSDANNRWAKVAQQKGKEAFS